MARGFRPRIGGLIFYLSEKDYRKTQSSIRKFPSPYWGLIFYQNTNMKVMLEAIGDVFPSPFWRLFFYLHLIWRVILNTVVSFRPHIRDYFFRMMQARVLENDNPKWFPSPY